MDELGGHVIGYVVGHVVIRFVALWPELIWHGTAAAVGVASWWLMLGGTVMLMAAKVRRRQGKRPVAQAEPDDASGAGHAN